MSLPGAGFLLTETDQKLTLVTYAGRPRTYPILLSKDV